MLSNEQKICVNLVVENMPEPIKQSPVIMDVVDLSMRHIMGGDPLESLQVQSVRQILANTAVLNDEKWRNYIKSHNLDSFANCFLNKSPEIMMSLFDHCQWAPTTARKIVKITFKSHHLLVQVNENTFFNVKFTDSEYVTPDWLPYILRRFLLDGVHSIDIKFEGAPEKLGRLQKYHDECFAVIKNCTYSARDNYVNTNNRVTWKYNSFRGSLSFAGHSKRDQSAQVFANFEIVLENNTERDVNEVLTADFCRFFVD
ncbi:hypothetical protein CRE_22689 [Caenorhabditis remanei]|uniref:Uncharacterized protein n=1 Tax=Caenorhabditis remanei TaxID=31234 RepID=E3NHK0_CAERE|nr:hypothetical protein CRE_22689 [Caenorhabditis remanei]